MGRIIGYSGKLDWVSVMERTKTSNRLQEQGIWTRDILQRMFIVISVAILVIVAGILAGYFQFIETLPVTKDIKKEHILLVHSTPKEPEAWHYLLTLWDAEINFHYFHHRVCMIGHSHLPFVIERVPSGEMITHKDEVRLGKNERYIMNAGSVGQPRDRDPRACYAIFGDDMLEFVRLEYAVEKTQKKMRDAGLPLMLIERLSKGT